MRPRAIYVVPALGEPPTSGSEIRAAAIVRALARPFDLTVLSLDRDGSFDAWASARGRVLTRRHSLPLKAADLLFGTALGRDTWLQRLIQARASDAFASIVGDVRPSLVVLGRPFFGPFVDATRSAGSHVVVDADESLRHVYQRIALGHGPVRSRARAAVGMLAIGRLERRTFRDADLVWVSSEIERRRLAGGPDSSRVYVIPNVAPAAELDALDHPVRSVAYVGAYDYPPNEAAALELLRSVVPAIRRTGGPHRVVLIGRDPTHRMAALGRRLGDVEITGRVDAVQPHLAAAGLLVLPIRAGGGTRVKILEAAAAGVPIITTHLGMEGLGLEDGKHVLVAETPTQFAAAALRVQRDGELRRRLTSAARDYVRLRHSQATVDSAIDDALAAVPALTVPPFAKLA